jgi:hypothetical protein
MKTLGASSSIGDMNRLRSDNLFFDSMLSRVGKFTSEKYGILQKTDQVLSEKMPKFRINPDEQFGSAQKDPELATDEELQIFPPPRIKKVHLSPSTVINSFTFLISSGKNWKKEG